MLIGLILFPRSQGRRRHLPGGRISPVPRIPLFLVSLVLTACFIKASRGDARTLKVPAEEATIAGGVGRATAGDSVLVAPGRYSGCFSVPDGVALIAAGGPDSTIIDGGGCGPVITFEGVGAETLLEGFTVTGGILTEERGDGAGVRLSRHASPRLNHNWITGNRALGEDGRGGGIACLDGSSPIIANSRIEGNEAADGGGIYIGKRGRGTFQSSPVVSGNRLLHNRARRRGGGLAITHGSEPIVSLNVVAWNVALGGGGGLAIERAVPRITENLIWANADTGRVAAGILIRDYAAPTIERNIVARNQGGPAVTCVQQFQERQVFRCNDVWGNPDGDFSPACPMAPGNLSSDPELCDPEGEAFGLRSSSPCRAVPECGRIGPFGVACPRESPR